MGMNGTSASPCAGIRPVRTAPSTAAYRMLATAARISPRLR